MQHTFNENMSIKKKYKIFGWLYKWYSFIDHVEWKIIIITSSVI